MELHKLANVISGITQKYLCMKSSKCPGYRALKRIFVTCFTTQIKADI